jgi:hypothetical protein
MTYEELRAKFDENASGFLSKDHRARIANEIGRLEHMNDAGKLVGLP